MLSRSVLVLTLLTVPACTVSRSHQARLVVIEGIETRLHEVEQSLDAASERCVKVGEALALERERRQALEQALRASQAQLDAANARIAAAEQGMRESSVRERRQRQQLSGELDSLKKSFAAAKNELRHVIADANTRQAKVERGYARELGEARKALAERSRSRQREARKTADLERALVQAKSKLSRYERDHERSAKSSRANERKLREYHGAYDKLKRALSSEQRKLREYRGAYDKLKRSLSSEQRKRKLAEKVAIEAAKHHCRCTSHSQCGKRCSCRTTRTKARATIRIKSECEPEPEPEPKSKSKSHRRIN